MYLVNRDEIRLWLTYVIDNGNDVIGPVSKVGQTVYDRLSGCEDFSFDEHPPGSAIHKYLIPSGTHSIGFNQKPDGHGRPRIFVGIRECDMAALDMAEQSSLSVRVKADYLDCLSQSQFYVFDCREILDESCFCYLLHEKDYSRADGVLYPFLDGYCVDLKSQASKTLFAAFLRAYPGVVLEQINYSQGGWSYRKAPEAGLEAFQDTDKVREACGRYQMNCDDSTDCSDICPTSFSDSTLVTLTGKERFSKGGGFLCVGCGRCTRHCDGEADMKMLALDIMGIEV